jgi:phosphoglycolate phosphatase-like HAD superfamily hydrolase
MKYYLFDIDGTLLNLSGVGGRALAQVFEEKTGVGNAFAGIRFGGMLDHEILDIASNRALGRKLGPVDEKELKQAYFKVLEKNFNAPESPARLNPNVGPVLESIKKSDDRMAVLTGNWHMGAEIKIGRFDLLPYFEFIAGSEDAETRAQLVAWAMNKFQEKENQPIPREDVVVVGDTPRDIECARENGVAVYAVATGPHSYEELEKAGPDRVLHTFEDW